MRSAFFAIAIAALCTMPASAGIVPLGKGLPPVQTVGVKMPPKLIDVYHNGGYDEPVDFAARRKTVPNARTRRVAVTAPTSRTIRQPSPE